MNATGENAETLLAEAEELLQARKLAEACAAFRRAENAGCDADRCSGGLWMTYMLQGQFGDAWRQSDAIRRRGGHDPHRFWNGEAIEGKRVMVRCLHGFGDAVQMFRYLPLLQDRCAKLMVQVPPRMVEIASCFCGMGEVMTWGDGAPAEEPAWDVQMEIMELPYVFRTEVAQLPMATRYLLLPEALQAKARALMPKTGMPRVGMVWSTGEWNLTRAVPFAFVEELVRAGGFAFWNLQGGAEHEMWRTLRASRHLHDAAECGDGILNLAAVIAQMDLVITPDTLAAHLAGALGVPAYVLLQHAGDWRWMHGRTDSPWYPSLELLRQPAPGDWRGVMKLLHERLLPWKQNAA